MAKKKSTKFWIIIIGIVIVILGLMAWYKAKNTTKGLEVNIEQVARRSITQIVSASGKIYPEKEVKISSDVSGEIIELYVAEGDSVIQGQLLLKINPDAYMSAVERGRALLNDAKAQYAMSLSNVESSKAQKSQITANLKNTRGIHARNKSLYEEGVISKAEWEKSLATLQALEANLASANANINASKRSAEASSYRIKSAEASLNELKTNLSRTTISAPVSGIISKLNVESGERVVGTIQMTGTEIMRIANLANMEVQVEVSENDIVNVALGDEVDIEVDAYLGKTFVGHVTEIAHSAANTGNGQALNSNQVTNFIVKIRIDPKSYSDLISSDKKYPFRPGMSATVEIKTEQIDNALVFPFKA